MSKSNIPYCDYSWNTVCGCTPIAAGCKNCWAELLHNKRHTAWYDHRWPTAPKQYHKPFSEVQLLARRLEEPLHWRKPRTIFVNSMSDIFHKDVPGAFRNKMWAVIEKCPQHTFLIFTKRFSQACGPAWWPKNVHLYFSISTQVDDDAVRIL